MNDVIQIEDDSARAAREFLETYNEWAKEPVAGVYDIKARECLWCVAPQQPFASPYSTRARMRCCACGRLENEPKLTAVPETAAVVEPVDQSPSTVSSPSSAPVGGDALFTVECTHSERGNFTVGKTYAVLDKYTHGFLGERYKIQDDRGTFQSVAPRYFKIVSGCEWYAKKRHEIDAYVAPELLKVEIERLDGVHAKGCNQCRVKPAQTPGETWSELAAMRDQIPAARRDLSESKVRGACADGFHSARLTPHPLSDEARARAEAKLPSGWEENGDKGPNKEAVRRWVYRPGRLGTFPVVSLFADGRFKHYGNEPAGYAPSMLRAMCCALGIELRNTDRFWIAVTTGDTMRALVSEVHACLDAEECAELALERYHAIQDSTKTEKPSPAAQETGSCSASDKSAEPVSIGVHSDADTEHAWIALNLVANDALKHFGAHTRIVKLLEEQGELQAELSKILINHKRADTSKVIGEIADVFITLESVAIAFGFDDVERAIVRKLERLADAINTEPATTNAGSDTRWLQRIKTLEAEKASAVLALKGGAR